MAQAYDESNNKTGYPISGGAKSYIPTDTATASKEIQIELQKQQAKIEDLSHMLFERDSEIMFLKASVEYRDAEINYLRETIQLFTKQHLNK